MLTAEGLVLQGPALREPAIRTPWPDWIEWKSGRVWYYDFTHFTPGASGSSSTLVSAEETSSQIEAAFLAALDVQQLAERSDARLLARLRSGEATQPSWTVPKLTACP